MQNNPLALQFINTIHNRTVWTAALPVLKQLNHDGIPVMVLKGPMQLEELHGTSGARATGDVDLLVPGDRAADAIEVMSALGWKPYRSAEFEAIQSLIGRQRAASRFPWHFIRTDGGFGANIDFHSDGMDGWRDPPLDGGIWDRAVRVQREGVEYFCLGPDDRLVYLCWHFMADGLPWPKLIDIERILERHDQLDWNNIEQRASQTGMCTVVYLVCELARARASSSILPSWRSALTPPLRWRRILITAVVNRIHTELRQRDTILLRTLVYDRPRLLLSATREILVPDRPYMAAFGHGVRTSGWAYAMGLLNLYAGRIRRR